MRDAFIITITLVGLFLLVGYMYNLMSPYFMKLGVLEETGASASGDGGIFRSLDSGRSWGQIGNGAEDIKKSEVFAIQFDEKNLGSLTVATSKGLFGSDDAGDSWRPIPNEALFANEGVTSFALDHKNSQRMYVSSYLPGGRGRILKYKGGRFYEVYSTSDKEDRVLGVWLDPYDTSTIYAGTQTGLFLLSKDFGESWSVMRKFDGPIRAAHMLPSDTRIVYAQVGGKVFLTKNQGESWQDISASARDKFGGDFKIEQIIIDPHNENRVYAASNKGLMRSYNGGVTFSRIALLLGEDAQAVSAVGLDSKIDNVIYIASGSQIHKSEDGGKSWQVKKLDTSRSISVIKVKPNDSNGIFAGTGK
ncbi:MAG: hypothetical protein WAP23_01180 [Candidatus Spechtbacterales bacterium]